MILKKLFSSSIRVEVLSLLFSSPDEIFYIREIAKLLKKNPSGIKRELDNLEHMEIVLSEKVANLRYFQANRESPFFHELKNLLTKSLGLPGALKVILRNTDTKSAFIYGPYAEGNASADLDLVVVGSDTPLDNDFKGLEKTFGHSITWIEMDVTEYRSRRRKKDPSLMRILSGKRISLVGRA